MNLFSFSSLISTIFIIQNSLFMFVVNFRQLLKFIKLTQRKIGFHAGQMKFNDDGQFYVE